MNPYSPMTDGERYDLYRSKDDPGRYEYKEYKHPPISLDAWIEQNSKCPDCGAPYEDEGPCATEGCEE